MAEFKTVGLWMRNMSDNYKDAARGQVFKESSLFIWALDGMGQGALDQDAGFLILMH